VPTLTLDLTRTTESLWGGIKKTRRADIKRAKRLGIKVEKSSDEAAYKKILNELREKLDLPLRNPKPNPPYLFIAIDAYGETLAAENFYKCKDSRLRAESSATKRIISTKKTASGLAHALLIWETILWAKSQGFKTYDFGGYALNGLDPNGRDVSGVNFWKKSFGGAVTPKTC